MKVFCFGNPLLKEDSLALEIADTLEIDGIEFVKCNSFFEIPDNAIILDVANGIDDVTLIDDVKKIKERTLVSPHDFDLGTYLRLSHEAGTLNGIRIICLPHDMEIDRVKERVKVLLEEIVAGKVAISGQ